MIYEVHYVVDLGARVKESYRLLGGASLFKSKRIESKPSLLAVRLHP